MWQLRQVHSNPFHLGRKCLIQRLVNIIRGITLSPKAHLWMIPFNVDLKAHYPARNVSLSEPLHSSPWAAWRRGGVVQPQNNRLKQKNSKEYSLQLVPGIVHQVSRAFWQMTHSFGCQSQRFNLCDQTFAHQNRASDRYKESMFEKRNFPTWKQNITSP